MKRTFIAFLLFFTISTELFSQGNWQTIPFTPSSIRFDDMNFSNDSTGYISQFSEVYQTTDRGENWYLISLLDSFTNYYVRSVEFINDTVGFSGLLESNFGLSGNLYKTMDGGFTWSLLQNMQIQPSDGICGMAHYGNSLVAVGTWSYPAWFYRTNDQGSSWFKKDLSALASGLVDCYMFNSDTILVSGIADSLNQYRATILKSFDGGNTWQRVYLAPATNQSSYCWKMFFRPNGLGISSIEGGPAIIARTTDNGNTWTTISVYNNTNSDLGGIGLLNDTLGWVTDQHSSGTWETHNGGLNWNAVTSDVISGDRMVVIDSVTALMAGLSIYKYQIGLVGINEQELTKKNIHDLFIYPNPSAELVTIEAIAETNTYGLLDILNENGGLVQHIARQPFRKGKNSFTVNIENLPAGNYKLLWRNNERFIIRSLTVIK